VKAIARHVATFGQLDQDAARDDRFAVRLELACALEDVGLEPIGAKNVPEGNRWSQSHGDGLLRGRASPLYR
jgi:hypothetical protein